MQISTKDWKNYIEKLSKLNNTAGEKMSDYVARHGFDDPKIIDYAYGLVTKYGEGSASLSAMMYDAIAEMEGKILPPAEVAETPEYGEVAKAINGVRKQSRNPNSYGNAVNRLVKRTGADTMLKNAERDGAEFAWIPSGDTCAFCIALASRGWQHISKKALKNGHAEHIHANCDCNYTVRFDGRSSVAGYDPDEYLEIYENAEGNTPEEKINSIRAKYRAENRDKINAQKRDNYLLNKINIEKTNIDDTIKLEKGNRGRRFLNKETLVDLLFVNSPDYRKKIDLLTGNSDESRMIHVVAKDILKHRSGTKYEDLAFVDTSTKKGKILINKLYDYYNEEQAYSACIPSKSMLALLKDRNKKFYRPIIAIHNHPFSTVPSVEDIQRAVERNYKYGIVLGNNSTIYKYEIKSGTILDDLTLIDIKIGLGDLQNAMDKNDVENINKALSFLQKNGVKVEYAK